MFNIGFSELIILGVIVVLFVDPKKIPELARIVGRLVGEFRRATSDFKLTSLVNNVDKEKPEDKKTETKKTETKKPEEPKEPSS